MQTPEQDPNSYAAQIKGKSGLRRIINACGYTRDGFKAACEEQGFRQLLWLNIPLIVLVFILPFGLATRMILIASSFLSLIVELFNTGVEAAVDHTSLENTRWPSGRKTFAPPRRAWLCYCLPCCGCLPCGENTILTFF